jgi:hypothetical protein
MDIAAANESKLNEGFFRRTGFVILRQFIAQQIAREKF